jgi:uncharacterized protein
MATSAESQDEADEVALVRRSLRGVGWVDRTGTERPIGPDDILVVAPYDNQVAFIEAALPTAHVGTVDRFQGQEAAVVIHSMTSTSAGNAPRGVSFLHDLHRLDVAVSRARGLAVVVVHSPGLLDAPVRHPAVAAGQRAVPAG